MSLTLQKRIALAERLRSLFIEHGRHLTFDLVPFFSDLNPEEQDVVKKILKKFRSGSHTPDSLIEEYRRWVDGTPDMGPALKGASPELLRQAQAWNAGKRIVKDREAGDDDGPRVLQRVDRPQGSGVTHDHDDARTNIPAVREASARSLFREAQAAKFEGNEEESDIRAESGRPKREIRDGRAKKERDFPENRERKSSREYRDGKEVRAERPKREREAADTRPVRDGKAARRGPEPIVLKKNDTRPKTMKDIEREERQSARREKKAERRRQKNVLEQALINALRENREFSDYTNVFLAARQKKRKLIAYLGPTNSGKTHQAMEALAKSGSGVYLGPLRLMALENYDRLREKGVKAGLLTGEERLDLEEATHVCQTIETADFNQSIEVAVIDEIQLLTDKDRGGFWLNAMIGIAADTVYLCGAPFIENVLHDLAELTGDEIEIRYTQRKSPLEFATRPEDAKKLPTPGTAFIAFSRKNVLLWKEMLEGAGAKVSVVYGALSPEVRKEQSRRFREGETEYLVATDAVGMGLNLPIQKILFTEIEKFDGEEFRNLGPQEVKQIGGRAGRFGMSNEAGIITSYVAKDLGFLKQCYNTPEDEVTLRDVHMQPTSAHVRKICESFNDHSLEFALKKFGKIGHEIFSVDISDEELIVADRLDRIFGADPTSLSVRWFFGIAPADPKNEDAFDYFVDLAIQYKKFLDQEVQGIPVGIYADEGASLQYAETQRKNLTLYLWFANKKPEVFVDKDQAHELATFYDNLINKLLAGTQKKKKKTTGLPLSFCVRCKAMMPPFSVHDVCRDCFQQARRREY